MQGMFNQYRNPSSEPKMPAEAGFAQHAPTPSRGIAAGRFLVPRPPELLRRRALVEVRRDVAAIARNCRQSPLAAAFHGVRQTPGGDHSGVAAVGASGLELGILPVRALHF